MNKLVRAIDTIFTELKINRQHDWEAVGGRAGVGVLGNGKAVEEPIWNDKQLGLLDGTTPRTLRNGDKPIVNPKAVGVAQARFNSLLGKVEAGPASKKVYDGLAGLKMKTGGVPAGAGKIRVRGTTEMPTVPQAVVASA